MIGIDKKIANHGKNEFLFIPLGGANEIGMNLNLYKYKDKWLMVDCGIGFADNTYPGIDVMLPRIDFLIKNNITLEGMVITHIHEDHIGAIPYIWERLKCKIYTTKLASEFLKAKLSEFAFGKSVQIKIFDEGKKFNVGPFELEPVGITHSVPEMNALFIHTPYGPIFHTGDWKLDKKPVVSDETNFKRIKELSKRGVYAMICDSTNIFNPGYSGNEGDLEKGLYDVIKKQNGMVVVTTFASNLARLKTIADVAKKTGRHVFMCGRSIIRMVGIAQKCGYLLDTAEFLDQRDAVGVQKNKMLVISTGCQGEELAGLSKMADGKHNYIKFDKGDIVVFSSKIIPGNEKRIFAVYNKLARLDVDIVTEKTHNIHVSGHPNREELKKMYTFVKPRFAVPVHGEPAHIREHCIFAKEVGVESAIRVKNGDALIFKKDSIQKLCTVESGYDLIDGYVLRPESSDVLNQRRTISTSGSLVCVVGYKKFEGQNEISDLQLVSTGFMDQEEDGDLYFALKDAIYNIIKLNLSDIISSYKSDKGSILKIEKQIKNICSKQTGKEPFVKLILS